MKKIYVYTDHPYCVLTGKFCEIGDCYWWDKECRYKIEKKDMEKEDVGKHA